MNRETGQPFGRVTFSGGVAEVTEDSDTRSALGRADAALYRAKAGRPQTGWWWAERSCRPP